MFRSEKENSTLVNAIVSSFSGDKCNALPYVIDDMKGIIASLSHCLEFTG